MTNLVSCAQSFFSKDSYRHHVIICQKEARAELAKDGLDSKEIELAVERPFKSYKDAPQQLVKAEEKGGNSKFLFRMTERKSCQCDSCGRVYIVNVEMTNNLLILWDFTHLISEFHREK